MVTLTERQLVALDGLAERDPAARVVGFNPRGTEHGHTILVRRGSGRVQRLTPRDGRLR